MPETIYGCCCKTTLDSLIMINSNHSKGIQNVTIAHELYHLLFEMIMNGIYVERAMMKMKLKQINLHHPF